MTEPDEGDDDPSRGTFRKVARYLGPVMLLVGLAIVVGGLWVVVTGLLARSQLQSARNDVVTLRAQVAAGNLSAARSTAHDLRAHADKAESLTSGPAWAVTAAVPGGAPFGTVRTLTDQIDVLATDVVSPLVAISDDLEPRHIVGPGGRLDIAPLVRATPVLDSAMAHLDGSQRAVAARPTTTWVGPVDTARASLLQQFSSLSRLLHVADTAAHVAPTLLGADGPKRYFVGFQNDAEMRGTGGLPGAFGIVLADRGVLRFEKFENDGALGGVSVDVPFGSEYARTFAGSGTEQDYRNTNLSPNFPYAAQLWMAMWHKKTGQRLDGALTLDPTALSYLLRATGPVTAKDGTAVTADNVVDLTQRSVYSRFPTDVAGRKEFLLDVARSVSNGVLQHGASADLIRAAARAVAERRLLLYSADSNTQQRLADSAIAGEVPDNGNLYSGLSVVNLGGNKLDYYLDRSVSYQASGCGAARTAEVTIILANAAPAGLPAYVTNRVDRPPAGFKPGDNRLLLSYYATRGATITSATLDGKTALFYPQTLLGHPIWAFDVELPRGAARALVLTLHEPGTGPVEVFRQPGVRALRTSVQTPTC